MYIATSLVQHTFSWVEGNVMLELISLIGDLIELLLSWRLFLGIGITVLCCWILFSTFPMDTTKWALIIPAGLIGGFLSFRWQIRSDFDK
jgi:hypothetical protein